MIQSLQSLLLLIFLGTTISINAQDILLQELFDDSTLGVFTQFSEVGDGETWRAADFGDKFFAQMNGFNGGVQDNIDWLISPAIDMDQYEDEILTFENAANFSGPDLELLYSVDYDGSGDPTNATWTDISEGVNLSPGGYEYVDSGEIDLSGVSGEAYIAFRYTSSEAVQGKLYQVDSIVVRATTISTNTNEADIAEKISMPYVSNDQLIFNVLDAGADVRVSINSMNGTAVSRFSDLSVNGYVSLPVSDLPNGVYILVAKSQGTFRSYKFIK